MDPRGVFSVSIVCLAIVVAVAFEPGTEQSRVAESSGQEATLGTALAPSSWGTNATASSGTHDRVVGRGQPSRPKGEQERVEGSSIEREREEEEQEEDYDGEEEVEDEYEGELKAVAESHEAMSRDDTKNSNVSTAAGSGVADGAVASAKNFDSHEVITVNDSDEDVASNEAITDEIVDKYDQEVVELLKYKRQRNANPPGSGRTKTKRVPTVKKELSTQREILIGNNETQVPKSLVPPEDTLNRLNEETETVRRRNVESSEATKSENSYSERSLGEEEVTEDNRYSESESESPKKLDKRQETELEYLKDLKSLLTKYTTEEEQRRKLLEPGAQDESRRENVRKLLAKLLEHVNHMERVQKLIVNVKNKLAKLSDKDAQELGRKCYEFSSTLFPATSKSPSDSRKLQKKFKRERKKLRHRSSTTTLTPVPATPPLLTTTETPWQTTPVQWSLVAERLFNPPWQQDLREQPEKVANARYSPQNPRPLPSIRDLIEQNKSKSNPKTFDSERKPVLTENVGDFGNQRVIRFGSLPARQGHREFANGYERLPDPERMPEYEVPEAYHRLRYNQMPPASREYLRRQEEDYQSDFSAQGDSYARGQDYDAPEREFSLSKSWPDVSYKYSPPWNAEQRPLLPVASEKWPWVRAQNGAAYWSQRGRFQPVEESYWSPLSNEGDRREEAEAEKLWQQQRAQYPWDRERSSWPMEKPLKVPPAWQQSERPVKLYDREQSAGPSVWEKSKNRSELNRSSTKQEGKDKVVLPQITIKTWNSLTSDPATWPYKLPGAKPWPKDENGKSYNPNADLVKKLGLDKQNSAWSKEEAEKSNAERKMKEEKQSRLFSTKESSKEEEFPQTKASEYKSTSDRSNFSDYRSKTSESIKPWAMLAESKSSKDWAKPEDFQGDDASAWRRKYDGKRPWANETALPKIQSVGAWVMSADQSTWKPYPIKPIESFDDTSSRRWVRPIGKSSADAKWPSKGSWAEKVNESWMDRSNPTLWQEKPSIGEIWPGKSSKPDSWYPKAKASDGWASKLANDEWKSKEGEWLPKPEDSWPAKGNGGSWSTKSNESWTSKTNDDASKFTGDSWQVKAKEEEDVRESWPRKSEQSGWGSKGNDLSSWQQKMNEEWSYGKGSSTGTWPSKWKQFAYHRVTAMPIPSKPGTTADAGPSKAKNAFVAVSAVSSPKYTGNEWRKNEDEARNENARSSADDQANQLQVGLERPIYAWKKDPDLRATSTKVNSTADPLENELEALRQINFWFYKENEHEKRLTTTGASTETASTIPANSTSTTTTTAHRRAGIMGNNGLLKTNRRTISMK